MPDRLRREAAVLDIVRRMDAARRPIAFICHGGWILISAGILRGRRATSTRAIRDDMVNAGCLWVDEPLVIDEHLISSRNPGDLHRFARALVERLNPA
jgi:protease I